MRCAVKDVRRVLEGAGGCALYAGDSEWRAACAMGAWGHALYAVPHSGGFGGRVPFAAGARAMHYVLEAMEGV